MTIASRLIHDVTVALALVKERLPGFESTEGMTGMTLVDERGAAIVSAVFEGFTGRNLWITCALNGAPKWALRELMQAAFCYAFIVRGVSRLSARVDECNVLSGRLCRMVGFVEECRMRGAAADGRDQIIFVMWRQDCRFIPKEMQYG